MVITYWLVGGYAIQRGRTRRPTVDINVNEDRSLASSTRNWTWRTNHDRVKLRSFDSVASRHRNCHYRSFSGERCRYGHRRKFSSRDLFPLADRFARSPTSYFSSFASGHGAKMKRHSVHSILPLEWTQRKKYLRYTMFFIVVLDPFSLIVLTCLRPPCLVVIPRSSLNREH